MRAETCSRRVLLINHILRNKFVLDYKFVYHFLWRYGPTWAMISSFMRFLDHTQRRIMVGRTPLDE